MNPILLIALVMFLSCNAKGPEKAIMVGGSGTTTPLWCMKNEEPQQEPAAPKEFAFKELTDGTHVTLQVGDKYLHRTMASQPIPRRVRTLIAPRREILSLEDTSQAFEIQSNQIGVFFMPIGANKPGTRTVPGFGPFKIVPVDHKNPSLTQVYLQNALDQATPQYVQIDEKGADNRSATLENATIFCIKVE